MVLRHRLIERLNAGITSPGVTLISAPAGFGKTTLVSEWIASCKWPVAWLSLDEEDNDPTRFLIYLVAALRTIAANIGTGVLNALQSPQPPSTESILTALINEISAIPNNFILVLDDYHTINAQQVDQILTFLLKNLPPQIHLVIATREDPNLPLSRLRARGQLAELRAADLRFTPSEAADFLNQGMGLHLSSENITALETRTEGWIAGLQLAAISMQGHPNVSSFIQSFTGSHHFVLDYLLEEVLQQQPERIQTFLLRTSILERLCGPLCDAILQDHSDCGQEILEYLERANLFINPLDNERRWYRYHRLFTDLLRQRLHQSAASATGGEKMAVTEYHIRASQWYEDNDLDIEAFHHAVSANDVERAERLIEKKRIPLHFRGTVTVILDWLKSLPKTVLDARPMLWVRSATLSLVIAQTNGVEEKLQGAEAALQGRELNAEIRNLIGEIAAARATLALTQYRAEDILIQSRRALEYLPPDNLPFRNTAVWTMAFAYYLKGDRAAAARAYTEAISISQMSGEVFSIVLATTGLAQIQALENQLYPAAKTYQRVLQLFGDHPLPNACESYLGLAQISYEWNDLDAAEQYGQQSLQMARQYGRGIDRFAVCELFLTHLKLARGDITGAAAMLAQTEQSVRQNNFIHRIPEIVAVQILILLRQGNLVEAARLAQAYPHPINLARVYLAQGDPPAALTVLEPFCQEMEARDWKDERLKVMVLQAVAYDLHGEKDKAAQLLDEALALAEPGGFIRIFVDEGAPMAHLLSEAAARKIMPDYTAKLLAAFEADAQYVPAGPQSIPGKSEALSVLSTGHPLIDPLSPRELEILQLIAQGLSNREISERLFLALDTVKGHNRRIFEKLQVQRRTEAVGRARELGLL
jgi:LuxR family maltose regulon positive regulatory protein